MSHAFSAICVEVSVSGATADERLAIERLFVSMPGGGDVMLRSGALATSGTTKRGEQLVDARSGRAYEGPWREVTACGATCFDADVAAKAGFLAGAGGPAWLDRRAIPGRFVSLDGDAIVYDAWRAAVPEPVGACI